MSPRTWALSVVCVLLVWTAWARADPPSLPPSAPPVEAGPPSSSVAPPSSSVAPPSSSVAPPSRLPSRLVVPPALARGCVVAAWKASGLADGDAAIDALVTRARASAWLPEMRVRATSLLDDASHATTLAASDGTNYYEAVGTDLVLELSLAWRLDRIAYSGDEAALERLRMMRQRVRSRVATRTLEVLFAWRRASLDEMDAPKGSREELDAWLRASEEEVKLDVLTDGWFSRRKNDPSAEPDP